jgi:hypothetical protein
VGRGQEFGSAFKAEPTNPGYRSVGIYLAVEYADAYYVAGGLRRALCS